MDEIESKTELTNAGRAAVLDPNDRPIDAVACDDVENPFIAAVSAGADIAALKTLTEQGFDPCQRDEAGHDALSFCVRQNRLEVVRWLVEDVGMDISVADTRGRTLLMLAALLSPDDHPSDMLLYLLARERIDIDAQDSKGWTALMRAARYGDLQTVSQLLRAGAKPDLKNNNRHTALILAGGAEASENDRIMEVDGALVRVRRNRFLQIVQTLLDHGADPTLDDPEGGCAINHALFEGNSDIAVLLWAAQNGSKDRLEERQIKMETMDLPFGKVVVARFYGRRLFEQTLLRASEFRESDVFAGTVFSLAEFNAWFYERNGRTYGQRVAGINLSHEALAKFSSAFQGQLLPEETAFLSRLPAGPFYLIGLNVASCGGASTEDLVLRHELSHALFFFDRAYRALAGKAWQAMPREEREAVIDLFYEEDYKKMVWVDEFAAHVVDGISGASMPLSSVEMDAMQAYFEGMVGCGTGC